MPEPEITRLFNFIAYLRVHAPVPVDRAAADLGVSRGELLDDLERLIMCGTPPYAPSDYLNAYDDHGVLHLDFAEHFRRPSRLTVEELLALRFVVESLPAGERARHDSAARSLATRLSEALAKSTPLTAEDVGAMLGGDDDDHELAVLRVALEARGKRRKLRLLYYTPSRDEITARIVYPLRVAEAWGNMYILAYCEMRAGLRSFRADRVSNITMLDEAFTPPDNAGEDGFRLGGAPPRLRAGGRVRVLFENHDPRRLGADWPEEFLSDAGNTCVRLTFDTDDTRWLARYLLRYGTGFRVEAPQELRREVARIAREAMGG